MALAMSSVATSIASVILRLVLPLVLLSLALAHAASPENLKWAEEINRSPVCPRCGYRENETSPPGGKGKGKDKKHMNKNEPWPAQNGTKTPSAAYVPEGDEEYQQPQKTNGQLPPTKAAPPKKGVADKKKPAIVSAVVSRDVTRGDVTAPAKPVKAATMKPGKGMPKVAPPLAVIDDDDDEDEDEEVTGDEDDEFLGEKEPEMDEDDEDDEDEEEEEEDEEAVVGDANYSKKGEGADPDNYAISGEMAVNLDDPKIQEEMREAAMKDPTLRKELIADADDEEEKEKIREILGDIVDDDDEDDEADPNDLDIEAEVVEDDEDGEDAETAKGKKKKAIIAKRIVKVNKLLADQSARMLLRKKILQSAGSIRVPGKVTGQWAPRSKTTMTAAGGKGRFSMIMAVSQGYLNSQLAFKHAITPAMHRISVKLDNGTDIDAALAAPQISLHFDDGTASSAMYHMNFGAGKCKLWNGTDLVDCETKDWKFAFMVNLSLNKVDSDGDEAKEVTKNWGKPGDYSISKLLVDLKSKLSCSFVHSASTVPYHHCIHLLPAFGATMEHIHPFDTVQCANISTLSVPTAADLVTDLTPYTSFGTLKHTQKTLKSFKCLVLFWLSQNESSDGLAISHSLTTSNPSSVVKGPSQCPATIPTSQVLQTYPYIPKGETEADEGLGGKANSNMLLFLNMTSCRPFPTSKSLSYSGSWCTPKIPGTLCIARQVLFDDFLLPLLREVNRATHLEATRCNAKFARLKSKVDFDIGRGKHAETWYDFKPTNNPTHNPNWSAWEWRSASSKEDRDGRKNIYCRGKINTSVHNTITPLPGTNRILVKCYAKVSLESKVASIGGRKGNASINRNGSFTIQISSVKDGNVSLMIEGLQPGKSPLKFEIKTTKSTKGLAFLTPSFFKRIETDMRDEVTDNSDLKKMATQVQERFGEGVGTFLVPGGGHFFIEGACFNDARDLMFETEFKGAN
ncbi:hypothetical protein MKZ38_008824 [Zalerion maritima]|uniref:Uncharacterized protein n=1 Tax=Zalerion maritima TaxID=339359 RepID=A0AAD5RUR8_9PEZI|nr:hypothetical protein MKZ38_008824 [Zalerion maritima]